MIENKMVDVYCDNMVSYYIFHSMHINITGRNFMADHKLLGKMYEDAQAQIDTIGEILRTLKVKVPATLQEIVDKASIVEEIAEDGYADSMLEIALSTTKELIQCYQEVIEECGSDYEYAHISNFAQDRVLAHEKFVWMLTSVLE
jgi:DNA-binding ferritin-like protein